MIHGRTATEFDRGGKPLVNPFSEFASGYMGQALILFSFTVPLAVGLHYDEVLIQSPLVYFAGAIAGFLASLIAWIPAFLTAGLLFGKWDFATEVFRLFGNYDFSIAMGFILVLTPITVFLTRTINRTVISYGHRKSLFIFAVLFSVVY